MPPRFIVGDVACLCEWYRGNDEITQLSPPFTNIYSFKMPPQFIISDVACLREWHRFTNAEKDHPLGFNPSHNIQRALSHPCIILKTDDTPLSRRSLPMGQEILTTGVPTGPRNTRQTGGARAGTGLSPEPRGTTPSGHSSASLRGYGQSLEVYG